MQYILNFCKGILIGAGAILPGISSGVLCVVFGIYEDLVNSVVNFFKDLKNSLKLLLPLGVGGFLGVVLLGNVLKFMFSTYCMQCYFTFMGLILGTTPALFKTANKKGFRLHYLIYTLATFGLSILLILLEKNISNFSNLSDSTSLLNSVVSGFLMSIGVVVPGVSSTIILMILDMYTTYLNAISTVNIGILIPMGIGIVFGGTIFLKAVQYLFRRAYSQTYYGIIGFSLGSILIMYPRLFF